MGNALKYEAMELSPLEKRIIMESWLALRRKLSVCGQTFILIFLEEHPEHLVYFPLKYRGNPDLAEILGLKVMREFSRIVSNLEALSEIAAYMREVAENHQPRHIVPKAFDDFRASFVKMLRKQLGGEKHLTLYLQCWDKLLKLINAIVLDIMNDIEKKSPPSQSKIIEQSGGRIQITPKFADFKSRQKLQCWDELLKLMDTIVFDIMNDIEKSAPFSRSKIIKQSGGRIQITLKYELVAGGSTTVEETAHNSTRTKFARSIADF